MTIYRRSKELSVLQRAEWLLQHHMLAGDLIPRLHWERIMAGQVRAAAAGNTKAAQFCKERAWPDDSAVIDMLAWFLAMRLGKIGESRDAYSVIIMRKRVPHKVPPGCACDLPSGLA